MDRKEVCDEEVLEVKGVPDLFEASPANAEQVVTVRLEALREVGEQPASNDVHAAVFELNCTDPPVWRGVSQSPEARPTLIRRCRSSAEVEALLAHPTTGSALRV